MWVTDKEAAYPDAEWLSFVEVGVDRTAAEAAAMNTLAQFFRVDIAAATVASQTLVSRAGQSNKGMSASVEYGQFARNVTTLSRVSGLFSMEKDFWTAPDAVVYAIVRMNRAESAARYRHTIEENGTAQVIYPTDRRDNNFIRAGETRRIPDNTRFRMDAPFGEEYILGACGTCGFLRPLTAKISDFRAPLGVCKVENAQNCAFSLSFGLKPHRLLVAAYDQPFTLGSAAGGGRISDTVISRGIIVESDAGTDNGSPVATAKFSYTIVAGH